MKTPVLFIGHANPMSLFDSEWKSSLHAWGEHLGKPKAVLMFSAHWQESDLVIGETNDHQQLLYDFYNFPNALYTQQYPAPGAPWLADQLDELLGESIPRSQRKLDHGIWIPLKHIWPQADVPILQISLPSHFNNQQLFDLGQRLAPLREQGIVIATGGTLSHNLREGMTGQYEHTPSWATEFDHWLTNALLTPETTLIHWQSAPHARRNHPTDEHFTPLLIAAGAATREDAITFPINGYEMGVFNRRSIQFG